MNPGQSHDRRKISSSSNRRATRINTREVCIHTSPCDCCYVTWYIRYKRRKREDCLAFPCALLLTHSPWWTRPSPQLNVPCNKRQEQPVEEERRDDAKKR